jgi:hypothetical protein
MTCAALAVRNKSNIKAVVLMMKRKGSTNGNIAQPVRLLVSDDLGLVKGKGTAYSHKHRRMYVTRI